MAMRTTVLLIVLLVTPSLAKDLLYERADRSQQEALFGDRAEEIVRQVNEMQPGWTVRF